MQACIRRAVLAAIKEGSNHLVLICVWQEDAYALLEEYENLAASLSHTENLEVLVLSKSELLRRYGVRQVQIGIETTYEINEVCENASAMEAGREVALFIDECWVTVPQRFEAHNTKVNCMITLTIQMPLPLGQPQRYCWAYSFFEERGYLPLVLPGAWPSPGLHLGHAGLSASPGEGQDHREPT